MAEPHEKIKKLYNHMVKSHNHITMGKPSNYITTWYNARYIAGYNNLVRPCYHIIYMYYIYTYNLMERKQSNDITTQYNHIITTLNRKKSQTFGG